MSGTYPFNLLARNEIPGGSAGPLVCASEQRPFIYEPYDLLAFILLSSRDFKNSVCVKRYRIGHRDLPTTTRAP